MTDAIPFNRVLNLTPGAVDEVVPGVRRILADNPGPFTFKGTLSYIIGRGKVAIVDPGPDDAAHQAALLDAVRGESGDAYHHHPYASRPLPRRRRHQGGDRRADFRRGAAPAGASAAPR